MSDVLISALARDRAVAEAIKAQFEQENIKAKVADPRALAKEATLRGKASERDLGPLALAKAVISVQTTRSARHDAVRAVARAAVASGARLMQALAHPEPSAATFPNAPQARLESWDLSSTNHPGLRAIMAFAYDRLKPPPPTPKSENAARKRIVILCDGTWQSLRNLRKTNVAHAAMAVQRYDSNGMAQITYYDDGVGALSRGLNSLVQGWTGVGLDDRILAAYRFLTLNYELGDEIYLFGFSRGAYTVRSLGGLIRTCGILRREFAHRELQAMDLYRQRETRDENGNVVQIDNRDFPEAEAFRQNFARAWVRPDAPDFDPAIATTSPDQLTLSYMGVWDTVGSLGVPPSLWLKGVKYQFHDTSLGTWVKQARHAVALDEIRLAFSPTLWGNVTGVTTARAVADAGGAAPHPTALQRWFAGDHGGVGGGDDREGLSNAALLWVLQGARDAGLAMKQTILDEFAQAVEPIKTPTRAVRLGSLPMYLRGWAPRQGLLSIDELDETAKRRLDEARPKYRPSLLKRLSHKAPTDKP